MSKLYSTVKDMQTSVNIKVLQGEAKIASNNKTLGFFSFLGIPAAPAGTIQIEVTFAIDSNGIVNVTAKNVATGQMQQMKVSATSGLTRDELEKLVQAAKGRIISSPQVIDEPTKKKITGTSVPEITPKTQTQTFATPVQQSSEKTDGDGEFLTGDMINSFLKDADE
jgi:molecular chaperone DnaK (HSP70)